jgi:hypothetical protein
VSERLEKIRKHVEVTKPGTYAPGFMAADMVTWFREDVPYLLQSIEKLEAENQRLQAQLERRDLQIAEIRQGAEF